MPPKVDSEDARELGEKAMRETAAEGVSDAAMDALAKVLAKVAKSKPAPLSVVPEAEEDGDTGTASWERQLIDPALVELALSLDVPLAMPPGPARSYTFWLYPWHARRSGKLDELRLVGKHPFFSQVLAASFLPTRETKDNVVNWLAKAVDPRFREGFKVVFDELDAFGKTLEKWTIGALEVHAEWIEGLCQPEVFALCPSLAKGVRELSPQRLLRNQLRAGIMDEWGYQAQDDALALFPPERHHEVSKTASGPLPYHVLLDMKEGRVVAFGPEGVVLDRPFPAAKKMQDVRNLLYSGGDVLVCEYKPYQARWAFTGGKPFEWPAFHTVPTPDGQLITRALKVFPVGSSDCEHNPQGSGTRIWFDGHGYYAHAQEVDVGPDGAAKGDGFITFDPTTGKKTGHGLPRWMAELIGPRGKLIVHIEATFILPVPKGAEQSPFGAKGGFGGFALYKRDGHVWVEGIDGRKRPGLVNGLYTAALMTFPAREGFYPVVESAFDIGIAMPDGTTPLVPMNAFWRYWAGTPHLSLHEWYGLRPRDLAASKVLAVCSDEAAKTLLDAATIAAAPPEHKEVKRYGKMQVVMTPARKPQAATSALADAVRRALPAVKHPRMVEGVAGIARAAVKVAPIVARLKSRVTTTTVAAAGAKSSLRNDDVGALARLFQHERPWWIEKLGIQLGQQILDVSHFLFEAHDDAMVTPAPTIVPWPLLLTRIGEVLYRVLAPGTPKSKRAELVKVLELWLETGFPSHMKTLRLVDLTAPSNAPELAGLDREHAQRLLVWGDRFFVSWSGVLGDKAVLHAIQAATGTSFDVPKGVTVTRADPADARFDVGVIEKTLALLEERGTAKLDLSFVERFAKKKKLSKAAATLLWAAGYDPWLVGEKKLATFQIERDALDSAEKELKKLPLASIYMKAMPTDPAELYDTSLMADRLLSAF